MTSVIQIYPGPFLPSRLAHSRSQPCANFGSHYLAESDRPLQHPAAHVAATILPRVVVDPVSGQPLTDGTASRSRSLDPTVRSLRGTSCSSRRATLPAASATRSSAVRRRLRLGGPWFRAVSSSAAVERPVSSRCHRSGRASGRRRRHRHESRGRRPGREGSPELGPFGDGALVQLHPALQKLRCTFRLSGVLQEEPQRDGDRA